MRAIVLAQTRLLARRADSIGVRHERRPLGFVSAAQGTSSFFGLGLLTPLLGNLFGLLP
jgi:hypothetical protein